MGTKPPLPDDGADWITFVEPDSPSEPPAGNRTWMVDAPFLRSNYRCIWGNGCQGVLPEPSPELMQGCCSYGAHLVDDDDVQRVVSAYLRSAHLMQFAETAREEGFLRPGDEGPGSTATRVVDGACIFFNRPIVDTADTADSGTPGSSVDQPSQSVGCALHLGALAADERPIDWKPDVCWQVPIRLDDHLQADGSTTVTLRRWRRSDWDDPPPPDDTVARTASSTAGSTMAWWCTESREAYDGTEPLYRSAREELIELMGSDVYEQMVTQLEAFDRRRPTHGDNFGDDDDVDVDDAIAIDDHGS